MEEIKVRWKKAALENCPGVPCITNTVPVAPTGVVATVGAASASVAFVGSSSNGGSAITGYTVTSSPGGITATGANSPINVTGLTNGTAYTFTVVATNAVGNSVPSAASTAVTPAVPVCPTSTITDYDSNVYNTVAIGTQCWTKENLKVTRYNDGTPIPLDANGGSLGNSTIWRNLAIGSYTIYANEASSGTNATNYGFLYNWNAVKGITTAGSTTYKNLCPTGYHVPADTEWTTLTTHLVGVLVAGGKMKGTGTILWSTPNTGADNTSGFTGLPGGRRNKSGSFGSINDFAVFWSTTEHSTPTKAILFELSFQNSTVDSYSDDKEGGNSVRCLKD